MIAYRESVVMALKALEDVTSIIDLSRRCARPQNSTAIILLISIGSAAYCRLISSGFAQVSLSVDEISCRRF